MDTFVGVDIAARRLDCAKLSPAARVQHRSFDADELDALVRWARGARVIAVDAPASPSTSPHAGDMSLSPKFRAGRCAEIALGREHGSWVPWVAPPAAPSAGWMATGFAAYEALGRVDGAEVIEVFPHAAFRALGGPARLARKRTARGRHERGGLLRAAGVDEDGLELRSHHELDALAAALVARQRTSGEARAATCGHDGSAIWLPARADAARTPQPTA